jgi:hypothetical protein
MYSTIKHLQVRTYGYKIQGMPWYAEAEIEHMMDVATRRVKSVQKVENTAS